MLYIPVTSPSALSSIVNLDWMGDHIDAAEAEAIKWIVYFGDAEVMSSVVALGWVQDGIEEIEGKAIQELSYMAYDDEGLASSVLNLGWIQDGIKDLEVQAIEELSFLSRKNETQVSRIVGMPFLEILESPDVAALESLVDLVWFRQADYQRVLSHPTLSNGITDDWAKIVATLYGVSKYNPTLIDTLLDPEQVILEEHTIDLPLAGETLLAIIRTNPGAERSMDLIEHAVRYTEEYMATSFPTGYVGWLFGDAVGGSYAGANFGTHIASLTKHDVDDGSNDAENTGSHIAHEVAHYYWRGNADWIDEGAASFLEVVAENTRAGGLVEVQKVPCGYVRTIAELEALEITREDGSDSAFICNYSLGERLFLDLYRNLGEDIFRQGLRDLYMLSQEVQEDDAEVGIEHVKTAFKGVEGVNAQVVDAITARWYDGTELYDTSARDIQSANPAFRTVSGRIDVAYLAASHGGPPATSIAGATAEDWLQVFLDYSYSVESNTEVPLEIVIYFEDGFVFDRRTVSFTAQPGYSGGSWWLSIGASPSNPWAPGKYEVYVYNEGRKLVELEYEVTE